MSAALLLGVGLGFALPVAAQAPVVIAPAGPCAERRPPVVAARRFFTPVDVAAAGLEPPDWQGTLPLRVFSGPGPCDTPGSACAGSPVPPVNPLPVPGQPPAP